MNVLPLIPVHLGGHDGPICTVELASKSLKGKIKYSDSDQLVIEIDNRNILIPKSEVKSITTEPKGVRAPTPAPKK